MRTEIDLVNQELMYEFHARDLTQTEALKQIADHAVKEIKATAGWNTDVEVTIEPEIKDKQVFSVCMSVSGAGAPIFVRKQGKHVMAVLKKVRRTVLRQLHRYGKKRITHRRKFALKERMAS